MKCSLLALSSYLDDELDPGRRAEIEAHLVGCERCRKGLECLREETERFGALGRVHVPDDAVSGFLQQLGLLGSGDDLAPRSPRPPDPPGADLPRWMGGGGAAQTLPWSARHNPEPPPAPPARDQPSLPFLDALAPSGLRVMAVLAGEPSGTEELHLNGRAAPSAAPPAVEEPVPGASEQPLPGGWPRGSVALGGVATWWAGRPVPVTPAGVEAAGSAAAGIEAAAPPSARIEAASRPPAGDDHPGANPAGAEDAAPISPAGVAPSVDGEVITTYAGIDTVASAPAGLDDDAFTAGAIDAVAYPPAGVDTDAFAPGGIDAVAYPPAGMDTVAFEPAEVDVAAPASAEIEAAAPAPAPAPEPAVAAYDFPPTPLPGPVPASPASLAPPEEPPPPATPLPPDVPVWPRVPAPLPADQMWPIPPPPTPYARASDDDGDPWSWAPRDDPRPPQSRIYPAPNFSVDPEPPVPAAAGAPSGRRPAAEVAATGQAADEDATPDPLIDPLIARVARPPQAVRATLISRLRDEVSLRLALMRNGDGVGARGGAAARTVYGHDAQPPESAGLITAALRSRLDPYGDRDAPALSAAPLAGGAVSARGVTGPEHVPTGPWTLAPSVRNSAIAEEIPRSIDPPRVRDLDRGPGRPGRHARQLGDRRWIGPSAGEMAPTSGRFGDLYHRVRRTAVHPRRIHLVVAALAILAVLVVTVSLLVTRPSTPSLASTGATSHRAPAVTASPALQTRPATALQPSASVAPSAAPTVSATAVPTPVPTPVPAPVVATQSFGSGGSGWTVEDVRYGTQPNGDLWIVTDFSGGSGEPRATASFSDPTTLDVTLAGAAESGLSPGTGGIVTKATVTSTGSTVKLVFDLSKAVTLKNGSYTPQDSSNPYPLHLILDVG